MISSSQSEPAELVSIHEARAHKFHAIYLLVSLTILLNIAKFWFDFGVGLNHQILTLFQAVLPILATLFLWSRIKLINVPLIVWIFLGYHLVRLILEILFAALSGLSLPVLVNIFACALKITMIGSLFFLLCSNFTVTKSHTRLLILYFYYTTFFSLLQLPMSPVSETLIAYGGNYVSGNGLGFFRANGGLGGTVIMYSNYLLCMFFLFFFGSRRGLNIGRWPWLIFFVAVFLCFSRSLFLSIAVLTLLALFVRRPIHFFTIFALGFTLVFINWIEILDSYDVMVGASDKYRVESWRLIVEDLNVLTSLMGTQPGANTGFFIDGGRKITGDGFILSWFYDYGLFGVILFIALIWTAFDQLRLPLSDRLAIFASWFVMTFVNSGFDKMFIVIFFFVTLIALKDIVRANSVAPTLSDGTSGRYVSGD